MEDSKRLTLARQAYTRRYEQRQYIVSWQGGGERQIYSGITGFDELTTAMGVTGATLNNYFSRYKNIHQVKRLNPTTGVMDIAYIERIDPPAKPKNPVGRPRKQQDWERLGQEAPGYAKAGYEQEPEFFPRKFATGTLIAESAKTVPKQTNRRTREKSVNKLLP